MAMVSGDVEAGDTVFVPRNCSCPFILRPLLEIQYDFENTSSGNIPGKEVAENGSVAKPLKYRLVGPAYVHGIMDGEFIETMKAPNLDEELVILI